MIRHNFVKTYFYIVKPRLTFWKDPFMGISSNISFKPWPSPSLLWLLSHFRSFVREIRSDGLKFVIKRTISIEPPHFFHVVTFFFCCCYRENGKKSHLRVISIQIVRGCHFGIYYKLVHVDVRYSVPCMPPVQIKTHLMTIINRPG